MSTECGTQNGEWDAGRVLVCFALKEEAAPFRKICTGRPDVSVLITGIGGRNARKAVREFLADGFPALVLTCGFAGGLNPALATGDVVFSTDADSSNLKGDTEPARDRPGRSGPGAGTGMQVIEPPAGRNAAHEAATRQLRERLMDAKAKPAKFLCAARIATTVSEKRELRRLTGADAVEMESGAIHEICREGRLPCATVRVISDTAGENLPLDFNRLFRRDLGLDYGRLAWALAKSPGKIGALLRLQKQARFAAGKLAEAVARVLTPR